MNTVFALKKKKEKDNNALIVENVFMACENYIFY